TDEPTAEPGSAIADGFTAVEGVAPIGPALPIGETGSVGGEVIVDEGWTAQAVVDADAVTVVQAYLDQARQLGLDVLVPAADEPVPCGPEGGPVESAVVVCWGVAAAGSRDPNMAVVVRQGEAAGVPQSHLELRFSRDAHWFQEELYPTGATAEPPGPSDEWPPLAGEGELIGADLDGMPNQVRVEPGSRLAGQPSVAGAYFGQSAVLEVTGDPAEVLARYREQLVETYGAGNVFDRPDLEVDGATLSVVSAQEAGGDEVTVTLVERPGETPWITMTSGHD
ncbi:MAG TPA: hypothetical protein VK507_19080, partial [Iamia sp.]|nr:hypothetical protein [Iamia sp.]